MNRYKYELHPPKQLPDGWWVGGHDIINPDGTRESHPLAHKFSNRDHALHMHYLMAEYYIELFNRPILRAEEREKAREAMNAKIAAAKEE